MVRKVLITPFQKFFRIESSSGILLFGSALLAIILANSSVRETFFSLWNFKFGISSSDFELVKPLLLWVNDGLMAIFFFLIGLEIKRELMIGELNSTRKIMLPLSAALGGMIIPVLFFLILNQDPATTDGWGIPMATDIAFSLAILRLLGNRIPIGLKVFLTAFAIVDDLGAVLIIAIFYSATIKWSLIAIALFLLGILFYLAYRRIHAKYLIFAVGIVVWYLFLKAGIHPTIAGVLLAFTIPIRQKLNMDTYTSRLCDIADSMQEMKESESPLLTKEQIEVIDDLESWTEQVQSPLQQLEHRLHKWVAFLIMPIFALSNSGVSFGGSGEMDLSLALTVGLSLVGGKFIGVTLFSWIAVKVGLANLPQGVNFGQIAGVSLLAGVGFTMAIFIANLAFPGSSVLLDSAKTGIMVGSLVAGAAGYIVVRIFSTKGQAN